MDNGENKMIKKAFKDKTYRIINIDDKVYFGKDSFKNRTSSYIINMFGGEYFEDKTVLDLGCASGAILFDIREKIKKGIGVDVDSKKLNIGKSIAEENNIDNISFFEERLEEFVHNTMAVPDCIFLLNILHHVQDPYGILNMVSELSNDMVCVEAPETGFYRAYARDTGKEAKSEPLNIQDIISFFVERDYILLKKQESDNQESFIGPKRFVCLFKKKR